MHIILGGTGHVGSAVAASLLQAGEPVTIVTRNAAKAAHWRARGAELAQLDLHDTDALRALFRTARRAFLLNPPADPATDTNAVELGTVAAMLAALKDSNLELVVAQSTIGARPGSPCGDLNVLYALEQGLEAQPIPARIVRAGFHYSNWDAGLETARQHGFVESTLPATALVPMVATRDVGRLCADLLRGETGRSLMTCEGPIRYRPTDVAAALSRHLGRPVELREVPDRELESWFTRAGFSEPAARSYACMTRETGAQQWTHEPAVHRGLTTLADYFAEQSQDD